VAEILPNTTRQDPSVLRMAAPLVVSFVMRAAFTMVDTVFAATIGDPAVAAIGLTIPFEFVLIAIWVGMSTGLTSNLSRAVGAGEDRRIEQYLKSTMRLVQIISPGFALVGVGIWFAAPHMGLDPEVARQFRIYGTTMLCGASLTSFWSILPDSMVKAHQDTRTTMWAGIISNVLNLVMNALFLFVFGWGIFGIALSTVLGRLGGLAYASARANAHEGRRKAEQVEIDCNPDPRPYRTLFTLAIPSALTFTLMASEAGLVNLLLSRMENATEAIVAYSIYYRVALFALNPIIAIGVALLPFTARRFGRGDIVGIRKGLREAGLAMVAYSVLIVGPVIAIIAPWVAHALTESEVSAGFTQVILYFVPVSCLLGSPFLLCRPAFEGMQRGKPGLITALVRYLGLTLPMAWLGIRMAGATGLHPIYGLVVGLMIASLLSSAMFTVWLYKALSGLRAEPAPTS
jgi:putative MATE family efflux protein